MGAPEQGSRDENAVEFVRPIGPRKRLLLTLMEAARQRGIMPVIPYRSNVKDQPTHFSKLLYRARARTEQLIGKLKRFKRAAMRCEKTQQNYAAFVSLACVFILVKSAHTAY